MLDLTQEKHEHQATPVKPCDCGSPNCNSLACINPKKFERNTQEFRDDYDTDLEDYLDGEVDEEATEEEGEYDDEYEEEEPEEEICTPEEQPPQPPSTPKKRSNHQIKDWADECLCSFRDTNEYLLRKYVDQYNKTISYSKHLQKLKQPEGCACPVDAKNKGTYVCGKMHRNYYAACHGGLNPSTKRTPAIARQIDKSPMEFLNRNIENFYKVAKVMSTKSKGECVVIRCPVSDDDDDDDDYEDDVNCEPCKPAKVEKRPPCPCKRNKKVESPPASPSEYPTCSSGESVNSAGRSGQLKHCPKGNKKSTNTPGFSQVSFNSKEYLYKKRKREDSQKNNSTRKIASRKNTPYSTRLADQSSVGTQMMFQTVEETSETSINSDDLSSECGCCVEGDLQKTKGKPKEQVKPVDHYCKCLTEEQKSQQTSKKNKRVISIRICPGYCRCPSPLTSTLKCTKCLCAKHTNTKRLNDRSRQMAQKYCREKPSVSGKCSISKLCLRKLIQTQPQCRTKALQEQSKKIKSSQCQFSTKSQRDFESHVKTGPLECPVYQKQFEALLKKFDGKVCHEIKKSCLQDRASSARNDVPKDCSNATDQCTCTYTKDITSSKQVSCQPLQSDHSTDTHPVHPVHPEQECQNQEDLCSCNDLDMPLSFLNFDCPYSSSYCRYNAEMKGNDKTKAGTSALDQGSTGCCRCGNNHCQKCMNLGVQHCNFGLEGGFVAANQWSQSQRLQFPYSERCHGPRYCMTNQQTPNQSFYPTTAVQVNSMELIANRIQTGEYNQPLGYERTKKAIEDLPELGPRTSPMPGGLVDKRFSPNLIRPVSKFTEKAVNIQPPTPDPTVDEDTDEDDDEGEVDIVEADQEEETTCERAKVKVQPNPALVIHNKVSSRPSSDANKYRESKRVSMKYDFPLYGGAAGVGGKSSGTDSIEERIRLLRQNLEQRHEFESDSISHASDARSLGTTQDRRMSIQQELEITNQLIPQTNKLGVSGGRLKK